MANMITGIRIVFSIALLFFSPLSVPFYILYILAGITDMIDGTVAVKTNTVSEFGSRLDTVADFILVIVCLIKLLPALNIDKWIYIWIIIIALLKIINIISGYVKYRRLIPVHSVINKITGVILFILPLTLQFIELRYSAALVCTIATVAAIQERYYIKN